MVKFAFRLYIKKDGSNTPSEYDGKIHYFNPKILTDNNKKGKPPNTFRFKKRSYLWVNKSVKSFTRNGEPIIKYEINNSIPNDGFVMSPMDDQEDLKQTLEEKKIASDLFDVCYARGEEKAVIAGSQKTKDEFSLKTFIIGAVTGAFVGGFIVLILVMQHVINV